MSCSSTSASSVLPHNAVAATGLDYFGARYFSGAQGRFTSPDPSFLKWNKLLNPQRWNLYSYAVNNPFKYVDPDGQDAIAIVLCSAKNRSGTHAATFSSQYSWWRPPRIAVLRTL
jgi:RHS repeat-associated protein